MSRIPTPPTQTGDTPLTECPLVEHCVSVSSGGSWSSREEAVLIWIWATGQSLKMKDRAA